MIVILHGIDREKNSASFHIKKLYFSFILDSQFEKREGKIWSEF